jgi:hypothetical protein
MLECKELALSSSSGFSEICDIWEFDSLLELLLYPTAFLDLAARSGIFIFLTYFSFLSFSCFTSWLLSGFSSDSFYEFSDFSSYLFSGFSIN